jgi:MFS transporter, YNFM family, putative membrane transport protein
VPVSQTKRTIAVILAGFCAFLQIYSPQPLLPYFTRVFNASEQRVSLTLSLASLGVAMGAPLVGLLSDRLGRRRIILWSAFLLGLVSLAAATSRTLNQLLFWRFLQGLVTPGVFSTTITYITEEWKTGAGAAISAYVSGTVMGGFSSRMMAGLIVSWLDWPWVFALLGLVNLAGAFALRAWLPAETVHGKHVTGDPWLKAMAGHLRNPKMVAAYAVGFCVLFSMTGTFTYITFHLAMPPFLLGTAALGSIFVVYLVGAAVTPVMGRLMDQYGNRRILMASVAAGLVGIGLTLVPNLWVIAVGLALCSSGVFASQTAASGYVGRTAESNRALAVGLYSTFYYTGGSMGAAIPGYFWTWGGWPACAACIAAVQVISMGVALVFWKEPQG